MGSKEILVIPYSLYLDIARPASFIYTSQAPGIFPAIIKELAIATLLSRVQVMIKVVDSMHGRLYSMFGSPDIMKYLQNVVKIIKSK